MAALAADTGGLDGRKLSLAALALCLNIGMIGLLSLANVGERAQRSGAWTPPVYLDIEPRLLLPEERPRPTAPSVQTPTTRTVTGPRRASSTAASSSTPTQRDAPPSPPAPRLATPAPQGAPAPNSPWTVQPNGGAFARSLRQGPVGCASPKLLNDADRAACRRDFNDRAERAPPLSGSGDARRDSRFAREGARKLQEYEARRRPLSGGIGNVGVQEGVGSNFGIGVAGAHLDPSFRPDSTRNIQTRREGPPASGAPLVPGSTGPGREPR